MLWAVDTLAALLPRPYENWLLGLSLLAHFTPFAVGAMYVSDFGFFLSVILLGLFLTVRAPARRCRMDEHAFDHEALAWAAGWMVAVVLRFVAGTRLPPETHFGHWWTWP